MKVGEVMTRGVEVASPDDTLQKAAGRMAELDTGVLPVGEGDRLVGMLTDRDITVRAVAQGKGPDTKVREAMTPEVVAVFEDQDVEEATRLMQERQLRRLLVMGPDRHVVGIVALGDLAVETGDERRVGQVLEGISEPSEPER